MQKNELIYSETVYVIEFHCKLLICNQANSRNGLRRKIEISAMCEETKFDVYLSS